MWKRSTASMWARWLSNSFSTQEHFPEGQETPTFRPHSGFPGRDTARRKVVVEGEEVKVVVEMEVAFPVLRRSWR